MPFGSIGFSSQSGALGLALLEAAGARGLGLSAFVSIGNKADVSSNDLLEWWEDDEATEPRPALPRVVRQPAQVRAPRAPRRPLEADPRDEERPHAQPARARRARTPPRSPARRPRSTRSSARPASCAPRRSRSCSTSAALLSRQPLPRGRRVAVLTNAGGLGILCADACEAAGLDAAGALATRRVPALRAFLPAAGERREPGRHARLGDRGRLRARACRSLLADPRVDAVIVLFVPPVSAGAGEVADAICERAAEGAEKPVLAVAARAPRRSRRGDGVRRLPLSRSRRPARSAAPPSAPTGCAGPAGVVPELDGIDRRPPPSVVAARSRRGDDVWLEPDEARAAARGVRRPARPAARRRRRRRRPSAAARELGFPVVVKSAAAGAHKTESGGVALDLARRGRRAPRPPTRIGCPVIVQPMLRGGAELLAGLVQDPLFGPLVAFGPGGVLAELIGEARSGSRRSPTSTPTSSSRPARPAGSSPASAARRPPTPPRSPTSCTGSRGSPRSCPRSPSST